MLLSVLVTNRGKTPRLTTLRLRRPAGGMAWDCIGVWALQAFSRNGQASGPCCRRVVLRGRLRQIAPFMVATPWAMLRWVTDRRRPCSPAWAASS